VGLGCFTIKLVNYECPPVFIFWNLSYHWN
jgi:hypothetical protein